MARAVVLYSGGLDSTMALEIVKSWGVQVYPLHISHSFLPEKELPKVDGLKTIDATKELIEIIQSPRYGFGAHLNPCIDCRILMLKKAKEYMEKIKADFVATGEVFDQRPFSQRMEVFIMSEKEAGLDGLVLRPLSGGLLPETIPEKKGIVKRKNLLKIQGRSRKVSLAKAKEMGIKDFFTPAGGCLLTDPFFSRRLADLMRFNDKITPDDITLLKVGRHFRLGNNAKLVVGREKKENELIEKMVHLGDYLLYVPDIGSPNGLLIGNKDFLKISAQIVARYSDNKGPDVEVVYKTQKRSGRIKVAPIKDEQMNKLRIN